MKYSLSKFASTLALLVAVLFGTCLVGCGDGPKATVIEQPTMTPEEQAAAAEEYNKSMDN